MREASIFEQRLGAVGIETNALWAGVVGDRVQNWWHHRASGSPGFLPNLICPDITIDRHGNSPSYANVVEWFLVEVHADGAHAPLGSDLDELRGERFVSGHGFEQRERHVRRDSIPGSVHL